MNLLNNQWERFGPVPPAFYQRKSLANENKSSLIRRPILTIVVPAIAELDLNSRAQRLRSQRNLTLQQGSCKPCRESGGGQQRMILSKLAACDSDITIWPLAGRILSLVGSRPREAVETSYKGCRYGWWYPWEKRRDNTACWRSVDGSLKVPHRDWRIVTQYPCAYPCIRYRIERVVEWRLLPELAHCERQGRRGSDPFQSCRRTKAETFLSLGYLYVCTKCGACWANDAGSSLTTASASDNMQFNWLIAMPGQTHRSRWSFDYNWVLDSISRPPERKVWSYEHA